jgi:hypothetical protein
MRNFGEGKKLIFYRITVWNITLIYDTPQISTIGKEKPYASFVTGCPVKTYLFSA